MPLIKTFAENIQKQLDTFDPIKRKNVVILFSAHSVPQYVMNRGDTYPAEIGATVQLVMKELNWSNPFRLVFTLFFTNATIVLRAGHLQSMIVRAPLRGSILNSTINVLRAARQDSRIFPGPFPHLFSKFRKAFWLLLLFF